MHLHGLAAAVVEVLAGQVEVELGKLERLVASRNGHVAALADDLDRRAQVLKKRAAVKVRERDLVGGPRLLDVSARDQVDGRLVRALGTRGVGGCVEGVPGTRTLSRTEMVSNRRTKVTSC